MRLPAIVVTGGAGFIGSATAPRLRALGLKVVVVDNLLEQVHPDRTWPAALPEDAELVLGDITDPRVCSEVLDAYDPRILIHLAAETGTGQSLLQSRRHAEVNVVGTSTLLDEMARRDQRPDHLVVTSSRAVYGEGAWSDGAGSPFYPLQRSHAMLESGQWDHLDPSGQPASPLAMCARTTHPNPSSVYGSTKLAQELILRNWASSFDIPLTVFRLQNVYGPGQSPGNPYTGIVTLFHRLASQGQALDIYEDGEIGRDFVYIADVVDALMLALENPQSSGTRILDVGTGTPTTIADAARTITARYGAPQPQVSGRFRDGDVRFAVADPGEIRALGWEPEWSFADGNDALGDWLKAGGYLG